jgi:hypothetical protein
LGIQDPTKLTIVPEDLVVPLYVYDSEKKQSIMVYLSIFSIQLSSDIEKEVETFTNGEIKEVKTLSLKDFLKHNNLRPGVKEAFCGKDTVTVIVDGEYFNVGYDDK